MHDVAKIGIENDFAGVVAFGAFFAPIFLGDEGSEAQLRHF